MTEDVARRSIDWLHDHGCRVLALMGGEPLLRPDTAHKTVLLCRKERVLGVHRRQRTAAATGGGRPPTYIYPEDWRDVDGLIDWLIEKTRRGIKW
jgi:hypothetical protein